MTKFIEQLRETIAMFACTIKSGEAWSDECQRRYDEAMGIGPITGVTTCPWRAIVEMCDLLLQRDKELETLARQRDTAIRAAQVMRAKTNVHFQRWQEEKHDLQLELKDTEELSQQYYELWRKYLQIAGNRSNEISDLTMQLEDREQELARCRPWYWKHMLFSFGFSLAITVAILLILRALS